jgi:hypothetical protein
MTILSEKDMKIELNKSREIIFKKTGIQCDHFAYPYGISSSSATQIVKATGYRSAVTTESPGWNRCGADVYSLRRFCTSLKDDTLLYVISGWQETINKIRFRK